MQMVGFVQPRDRSLAWTNSVWLKIPRIRVELDELAPGSGSGIESRPMVGFGFG
jgi:hypothetical protein